MFADLLFTPSCLSCHKYGVAVCKVCLKNLQPITKEPIPNIGKAIALSHYDGWVRDCVIEYKSGKYVQWYGLSFIRYYDDTL